MEKILQDYVGEETVTQTDNSDSAESSSEQASETQEDHTGISRQCGRKCVRKQRVLKRGLRKNSPLISLESLAKKNCCKKFSCLQSIPPAHIARVRQDFSTLTYDEQNLYLTGLLIRKEAKKSVGHKRKSSPMTSKHGKKVGRPAAEKSTFSLEFQIRNEKGLNQRVCQKAFILIHGFGKRRLEVLCKKIPADSTVPEPDRRGKHNSRPFQVPEELHQKVRDHIRSFPARQSHYPRHNNPGRVYLSPDLSIARMYYMFLAKHDPTYIAHMQRKRDGLINHQATTDSHEVKPIISEHYYHNVFVREFNIHFGFPRSDTCDKCDAMRAKIDAVGNEDDKQELEKELSDHLALAEQGYAALRKDCKLSKDSLSQVGNPSPP